VTDTLRIFVPGIRGQLGSELVRAIAAFPALRVEGADLPEFNLADADQVTVALDRADADLVINAAAYTAVDKAESDRDTAFAANADGVRVLARACRARGIPLLHVSTEYVFDGNGSAPWPPDAVPAPLNVYGASKLAGEIALAEELREHLVLRTSWVFGAQGANFVRTMLRLGREREELAVVADQVGGPTWAAHLAQALLSLAERYRRERELPWGTWHYAGQPWVSWHAFAETIFAEALARGMVTRAPRVRAIATAEYPTPAHRPLNSRLDMTSTTAVLHLAPPDWREGLAAVLDAWQADEQNAARKPA
jgi:dTDP-4-dehydrorhamnose reductase